MQFSSSDSEESLEQNIVSLSQSRFQKAKKLNKIVRKSRLQREKEIRSQKDELVKGAKKLGNYQKIYLARNNLAKDWLYSLFNLLTIGLLSIANSWTKNSIEEKVKFQKVKDLDKASHVICVDSQGRKRFIKIQNKTLTLK